MPHLLHLLLVLAYCVVHAATSSVPPRVENELALLDVLSWSAHAAVESALAACAALSCPLRIGAPDVNVSASPTLVSEGDIVTVSYAVRDPKEGYFVAMYINATSLSAQTLPLKWAYIDDAQFLSTGRGSRRFQVANFRALGGYSFGVLSNATRDRYGSLSIANAVLLAVSTSPVIIAGDVLSPQRPRLTPAANDGSVLRVTWTSGRDASSEPHLAWGLNAGGPYAFTGRNVSTTHLTNESLCGVPATGVGFSDLGFTHSAEILLADAGASRPTRIFYVLSDAVSTSAETVAAVPPPPGQSTFPATLLAFDDLGRGSLPYDDAQTYGEYGTPSVNTSRAISSLINESFFLETAPVAVWHVGDVSYATGYLSIWTWWAFMVSSWAGRITYVLGLGNHESGNKWGPASASPDASAHFSYFDNNDAGGECGVVSSHVIPLPSSASADEPWSAFASGPFFLVTLSSEHDLTMNSKQWLWLRETLAGVNRTLTPWLFVGSHRPMYIDSDYVMDSPAQRGRGTSSADVPVMTMLQTHVEPLTMQFKVSALFYGHNHAVQILTPAYRNASVQRSVRSVRPDGEATRLFDRPTASLHMVIGTGGAGFTPNCATAPGKKRQPPSWDENCFYQWGYATLTALSASQLKIDWTDASTGVVAERIDLVQDLSVPWSDTVSNQDSTLAVAAIVGGTLGGVSIIALSAFVWFRTTAKAKAAPALYTEMDTLEMRPLVE